MTLTGNDTLAHYQQVLDSVTYASTSNNPTSFGTDSSRTITWVINDGTLSSAAAATINITAVNDAPVIDLLTTAGVQTTAITAAFTARGGAVTVAPQLTLADVDSTT